MASGMFGRAKPIGMNVDGRDKAASDRPNQTKDPRQGSMGQRKHRPGLSHSLRRTALVLLTVGAVVCAACTDESIDQSPDDTAGPVSATSPSSTSGPSPTADESNLDGSVAAGLEQLIESSVDFSDIDLAPNEGMVFDSEDGTTVNITDGQVSVVTVDGEGHQTVAVAGSIAGWFVPTGEMLVFEFNPDAPAETIAWAEWVLASTPGVDDRDGWQVTDPEVFGTAFSELVPSGGTWFVEDGRSLPALFDATEVRFLYYWTETELTWAIDDLEEKVWVIADNASDEPVVIGSLTEGDSGVEFVAEPGVDDKARESIDEAIEHLTEVGLLADAGNRSAQFALHRTGEASGTTSAFSFGCGICGKFKEKVIDKSISRAGTFKAALITGLETKLTGAYDVAAGVVELDPKRVLGGFWDFNYGYLADIVIMSTVKDCGTPGPGRNGDGSGRPGTLDEYFVKTVELAEAGTSEGDEWVLRAQLAQAWMPNVKLSKGERCGEIIRIVARVYPYDRNGEPAEFLTDAARVQITYTIFYKEDGGIAGAFRRVLGPLAGTHPGDNEGFSVGLVRSNSDHGRCGATVPHFELLGGRSAAHSNFPKDPPHILRATSDKIGIDWADSEVCPDRPASWMEPVRGYSAEAPEARSDDPYFVWSSINKHGTYFHEDVCDAGLWRAEECIGGRTAFDLHHWVELVISDVDDPTAEVACAEGANMLAPDDDPFWPPKSDMTYIGPTPADAASKSFHCTARNEDDGKFNIEGLKTADFADFVPPPPASSGIVGVWTSIDHDSSTQWLWIEQSGTSSYWITYYDEGASACDESLVVAGLLEAPGVPLGTDEVELRPTAGVTCLFPGGEQQLAGLLNNVYSWDPGNDTIVDSFSGVTWTRTQASKDSVIK